MPDVLATLYFRTWIGLGVVLAYYISIVAVLRLQRRHTILVTRYGDSPQEIFPAVAAHLWTKDLYERAFASALVSLASKGYLQLGQNGDRFSFKKMNGADATLPPEEYMALSHLFYPGEHTYTFGSVEYGRLCNSYAEFKDALKDWISVFLTI